MTARGLFNTYCPSATPQEWEIFGRTLKRWGEECLLMALDRCRRYGDGEVNAYKVARWAKNVADEHGFQALREGPTGTRGETKARAGLS